MKDAPVEGVDGKVQVKIKAELVWLLLALVLFVLVWQTGGLLPVVVFFMRIF